MMMNASRHLRGLGRRGGRRYRTGVLVIGAVLWMAWDADAQENVKENEFVRITSERRTADNEYVFTITNLYSSPIVYIELPHFQADLFLVPNGWKSESTYLVNVGVPRKPGICTAQPVPPNPGISPGETVNFMMRVPSPSTWTGTGTAKIRFADGKSVQVPGVIVPVQESTSGKYMAPMGLAIVFALGVGLRTWMRRRAGQGKTGASDGEISA